MAVYPAEFGLQQIQEEAVQLDSDDEKMVQRAQVIENNSSIVSQQRYLKFLGWKTQYGIFKLQV